MMIHTICNQIINWFPSHNAKPSLWDDLEVLYLTYPNITGKLNLSHLHENLLYSKISQKKNENCRAKGYNHKRILLITSKVEF
jgi:hypothetical protein